MSAASERKILPFRLDLTEFNKLQDWLLTHTHGVQTTHQRREEANGLRYIGEHHQLVVVDHDGTRLWDAVISDYSYGHEQGLLEVMGSMVVGEGGTVEGWLTAEEIIKRLEEKDERHAVD